MTTGAPIPFTQLEVKCRLYHKSFYNFVLDAWPQLEPGVKVSQEDYMRAICDHLQAMIDGKIQNLAIAMPPGHGKSMIASVLFPVYIVMLRPHWRVLSASYMAKLSTQHCIYSRRLMETAWFQSVIEGMNLYFGIPKWSFTKDSNQKTFYENTQMGSRIASSVEGGTTGLGGEALIADDPISATQIKSPTEVENAHYWWREVWFSRLRDMINGFRLLIQQVLGPDDILHLVKEIDEFRSWDVLCLPLVKINNHPLPTKSSIGYMDNRKENELMSPERFPQHVVDTIRSEQGEYVFQTQWQQIAEPREAGIIQPRWWGQITRTEYEENHYKTHMTIQSWTLPYKEKDMKEGRKSKVSCTTWQIQTHWQDSSKKYAVLVDTFSDHMDFPDARKKALELHAKYKPNLVLVDKKAVSEAIRREFVFSGIQADAYAPDGDPLARLHAVSPIFSEGSVKHLMKVCNKDAITACAVYTGTGSTGSSIADNVSLALLYMRYSDLLIAGDRALDKPKKVYLQKPVDFYSDPDIEPFKSL